MLKLSDKNFIISDNHFFHLSIIKFCNRPYNIEGLHNKDFECDEIAKMNHDMLAEFDKLPEECTIWNNGDLFFAGESQKKKLIENHLEEMKSIVNRMKGPTGKRKLILILGNHDNLHRENESRIKFYYELGFDKVFDTPIIIEDNFILSHEPVYISPANNFKNLYGHTHDLDIKDDYFCYDYENYALETRIAQQEGREPEPIQIKWPERKIDLGKYLNVCWDKNHKILDLNKIISEMK